MPENTFRPARRIGRFLLSTKLIYEYPETVRFIFDGMIVVRAEMHFAMDAIDYTALGDVFEEVTEGANIPYYEALLTYRHDADTDTNEAILEGWKRT